jgi:formate dehydrogenase beta subunit
MASSRKSRGGGSGGVRLRPAPKGRAVDPQAHAEVIALLGEAPRRRDLLIEHLHRLQDHFGHLSVTHLNALAWELRLTPAEVFEVASFYHHFDIVREGQTPPRPLTVRVCDSIACHLDGSGELLEELRSRLGDDVRVIPAPCVGQCDRAPVAVVGRNPIPLATPIDVERTVRAKNTEPSATPFVDLQTYHAQGGYRLLTECVSGTRMAEEVSAAVEASGLRGLGGAGFPTYRKWQFVRAEPAPRYAVLNADEGEPGTFKDRDILERDPHRMLEGLLIAAWIVEASEVFIYLRDEYARARAILQRELAALRAQPPCPLPPIQLRRGAGAYICGEETSLIESVEGKRGEPRLRPPFPAQVGVFGRPTLVHNVETVYWLREILERGGESFANAGKPGHKGKRFFSVSGRVAKPGVYEAPNGVSTRELIERAGGMAAGHTFYAFLPGGASGGILPASLGDEPLDFDVLAKHGCFIGSAAIVILSQQDRARDAAVNLMAFFAHESCGKCTPCRVGTAKSVHLMEQPHWDTALLAELGQAMADASICGLGQAAPNPVRCVTQFFSQEL